MNLSEMTKEQLIQKINELSMLNKQLLDEKEQELNLNFAWSGNLGHWYWNIKTNSVVFNPLKITTLGYTTDELPEKVNYQFFTDKLHPEDFQKTMDAMTEHLHGSAKVYEAEYRIQAKDGSYKWYYDRGRITQYDENGGPAFLAGIVFDITEKKLLQLELEAKNKLLAEQSSTDGLTKVKNHRALVEHLKSETDICTRLNKPISIVLFDIDDFKKVNDTKGHIYGDKVLVDVASIMQKNLRENDIVGRYGGEEFLIILSGADAKEAFLVSDRIRKSIEKHFSDEGMKITVSGGLKEYSKESISDFIHSADTNLYTAKKSGKNCIV